MKKRFFLVAALAAGMVAFVGCSKDDKINANRTGCWEVVTKMGASIISMETSEFYYGKGSDIQKMVDEMPKGTGLSYKIKESAKAEADCE